MTSVKELGETLRRRQAAAEGAGVADDAALGTVSTAYAVLLVIGGCLALVLGALIASVGVIAPDFSWMADSLVHMGITSGAVLAAGTTLLGLGLVCRALAQAQRALLHAVRRSSGNTQLAENQEQIRDGLGKVHFALRVLQESTKGLLEIAHEQSLKREGRDHEDAVYHLAASLDQLGVRLEDRLDSQHSGLERRLGSLDGALEETRRRVAEWLDQPEGTRDRSSARRERHRRYAEEGASSQGRGLGEHALDEEPAWRQGERDEGGDEGDAERRPSGEGRTRSEELWPEDRRPSAAKNGADWSPRQRDEELEVVVTLEGEGEQEERAPERKRRKTPLPRRAPPPSTTPLGVLDGLDDFGERVLDSGEDDAPATSAFLFDRELTQKLEKMAALGGPVGSAQEEATARTQEKLAQLQALLSDTKLRKALEDLRRDADEA